MIHPRNGVAVATRLVYKARALQGRAQRQEEVVSR